MWWLRLGSALYHRESSQRGTKLFMCMSLGSSLFLMHPRCDMLELVFTDKNRPYLGDGSFQMREIQVYRFIPSSLHLHHSRIPAATMSPHPLQLCIAHRVWGICQKKKKTPVWLEAGAVPHRWGRLYTSSCFGLFKDSIGSKETVWGRCRMSSTNMDTTYALIL